MRHRAPIGARRQGGEVGAVCALRCWQSSTRTRAGTMTRAWQRLYWLHTHGPLRACPPCLSRCHRVPPSHPDRADGAGWKTRRIEKDGQPSETDTDVTVSGFFAIRGALSRQAPENRWNCQKSRLAPRSWREAWLATGLVVGWRQTIVSDMRKWHFVALKAGSWPAVWRESQNSVAMSSVLAGLGHEFCLCFQE